MIPKDKINRKGRKPGSKNLATQNVREQFQMLVESNIQTLQNDLDAMTPKERFNSIISLAKFVLPTLNSIDFNTSNTDSFKPIEIHFNSDDNK